MEFKNLRRVLSLSLILFLGMFFFIGSCHYSASPVPPQIEAGLGYTILDVSSVEETLEEVSRINQEILLSSPCKEKILIELSYSLEENRILIPVNIILGKFIDFDPDTKYPIVSDWDSKFFGNNVCVTGPSGPVFNYINIPLEVLLISPSFLIQEILFHETIHALQCQAGQLPILGDEEAHHQIEEIKEVCQPTKKHLKQLGLR